LPDIDGVEFIRDLRSWSATPIIVLSARSTEADKVTALDAGADDYLAKPSASRSCGSRARALAPPSRADARAAPHHVRRRLVDLSRRSVLRAASRVHLTALEYRLLRQLLGNVGKVLTHRHLLREVWGPSFVESNHYVRIYVARLRQKARGRPAQPRTS
jgi:two-component system KDP operon response regulator KdpE